jgi:cohesin loading factor subunit SCC2
MPRRASKQSQNGHQSKPPKLSEMAGLVYKTTKFPRNYPSPSKTPSPQLADSVSIPIKTVSTKIAPPKSAPRQFAAVQIAQPVSGYQTEHKLSPKVEVLVQTQPKQATPTKPSQSSISIQLPTVSARDLAGVRDIAEQDYSKKRKRDSNADYQDQREKNDTARHLVEYEFDQVSYAAQQYSAESDDLTNSGIFYQSSLIEGSEIPILSQTTISKLDAAIRKADARAIADIPIEKITRIQKLLQGTISAVTRFTLTIDSDASESDVDEWFQIIDIVLTSLQAMKALLRTMTSNREDKELYSEDILVNTIAALAHIIEGVVIPVVQCRTGSSTFGFFSARRKELSDVIVQSQRALMLLGKLVANVEISEIAVSRIEHWSIELIFVENAHTEKESILGIQRYETMRRAAMDTLASVFTRYPEHRKGVIDHILSSLEKLPSTRQSARQYKLTEGKPIQLVSALLMRLLQTSTMWTGVELSTQKKQKRRRKSHEDDDSEPEQSDDDDDEPIAQQVKRSLQKDPIDFDEWPKYSITDASKELASVYTTLYQNVVDTSKHMIGFLLGRALNTTKSGDLPYRNLLDIFTEDFLTVLGQPEWPAAEYLLTAMLNHLIHIGEDEKRAVPQKTMALDLMTTMAMRISELQGHKPAIIRGLETIDTPVSKRMLDLVQSSEASQVGLIHSSGPYRVLFEYLSHFPGDAQADSAAAFILIQWADLCLKAAKDEKPGLKNKALLQLRNTIPDMTWLGNEYSFAKMDLQMAKSASSIITLSSAFCNLYQHILRALLGAMNSSQTHLKSKGLKMITQLIEKDPNILDRHRMIFAHIVRCSDDPSPMVRQSALMLLEICTQLKPSQDKQACPKVCILSSDDNVGVRKKAMKLMNDMFLRNDDMGMRRLISLAFLQRTKDLEDSVADMARQNLESIWFTSLHGAAAGSVEAKINLQKQVTLLTACCEDTADPLLESYLWSLLAPTSKNNKTNLETCNRIVSVLFDSVIENTSDQTGVSQRQYSTALTIFAKVAPKLFTVEQLGLLTPYIKNVTTMENLLMYRNSVIVFRYVIPTLSSSVQQNLLIDIRKSLLSSITKIPYTELTEPAACLWNIREATNDAGFLVTLMTQVLKQLQPFSKNPASLEGNPTFLRIARLIDLLGPFGKICNLDPDVALFKQKGFDPKNGSVATLLIDNLHPFCNTKCPKEVRLSAIRSMGLICQSWPRQYLRTDITKAFELVFYNHDIELQRIVLEGFLTFFKQEEKRSETGAEIKVGGGSTHGQARLAKSFVANDNDGAVTTIAQKFLSHVLKIALATTDSLALVATEVIASINRQGLVHPKESGPALVALETSTNPAIARISLEAHQAMHSKHESMFEKEYMAAVQEAFRYQCDIIHDPRGITPHPYVAKLKPLFDVLKTGNSKSRKRFISNVCSKVKFELPKLDISGDIPTAVLFARFVMENLAFFDYARIDELLSLIKTLEDMVLTSVGATVGHAIETEVLKVKLSDNNGDIPMSDMTPSMASESDISFVNEGRLRQLAVASCILTMVWETRTHLRAVWGLQKSKVKLTVKDLNKAPTRQGLVSNEKFVDKIAVTVQSLADRDSQMALVTTFSQVIAIDSELRVQDEDDFGDLAAKASGYETPSEGEDAGMPGSGAAKGRKRKNASLGGVNTPKKVKKYASETPKKGLGKARKARSGSSVSNDAEDGAWD